VAIPEDVAEQVDIQVKYEGYIDKQMQQIDKMRRMEKKRIPENLDYQMIQGLATEAKQKLSQVRPLSVGQASRVSGVNPSDISILLVYLEQGKLAKLAE
jgi:tRNA uridine 5-carboxymethylaminomethyl modification enzyme